MTKSDKQALQAAKTIQEYCQKQPITCDGCIFDKHDPDAYFWKGCLLQDPDHLPETWELGKIGEDNDV